MRAQIRYIFYRSHFLTAAFLAVVSSVVTSTVDSTAVESAELAREREGEAGTAQLQASANSSNQSPTAWRQFNDQLFKDAAREHKLVLLDLEAVWCHWCHVMDKETYNQPEIAEFINKHFLAARVDQDSRPDVSNKYQDYGWPATVILSSDGRDLAKRSGYIEKTKMLALLKRMVARPVPEEKSKQLRQFSQKSSLSTSLRKELEKKHLDGYDKSEAGWSSFEKFLDADSVEYAMVMAKLGDKSESERARKTLVQQLNLLDPAWGGIYQYSTGGDWKHPHFEKIMPVQADNIRIYSLGYLLYKDRQFLEAAQSVARYLADFLTGPDGAFFTSQDADLVRGKYSSGYFRLNNEERRKLGIPAIDKHIYSRENGMAIDALATLYQASGEKQYLDQAIVAADWIIANRSLKENRAGFAHDGFDQAGPYLGDSLYMTRAFQSLYAATADRRWLDRAQATALFIIERFQHSGTAGLVSAAANQRSGLANPAPILEENIAAARTLNLLFHYTGDKRIRTAAQSCMRYLATPSIARIKHILVAGILLADREINSDPVHFTIVGARDDQAARALYAAALAYPVWYKRVDWVVQGEAPLPNTDVQFPQLAKAAAFVCAGSRCSAPAYTAEKLFKIVGSASSQGE